MWAQFLANPQAIIPVFREQVPLLQNLILRELKSRPQEYGEQLTLLLEWPSLPEGSPARWREKGCAALQLVLSAPATQSVQRSGVFLDRSVNVSLTETALLVEQPSTAASLQVQAGPVDARLFPYDGDHVHHGVRL
jgi:hypothetical protein